MELQDTIDLMTSDDYKERFIAEYCQLKIRYNKLVAMLDKWDADELDFEPTCPREWFDSQVDAMEQYLDVLTNRAEAEEIELPVF